VIAKLATVGLAKTRLCGSRFAFRLLGKSVPRLRDLEKLIAMGAYHFGVSERATAFCLGAVFCG
jgi:hypothetical protein